MSTFGDMSVDQFLFAVGAKSPTPGGGAVASMVGALGASLAQMVVNYSIGKKSLAVHEPRLRASIMTLDRGRDLLLALAAEDAEAYGTVNALSRLPEDDPRRVSQMPEAVAASVQAPMSTIAACVDLLRHFGDLGGITNRQLKSDLAIAAVLADAAARASRWNILVNVSSFADQAKRLEVSRQMNELLSESARLCDQVQRACEA